MISRSFFRQSAAFLWLSLCILTDSTPRMACNAQHPAPQATPPARPRRARGEEERERHGQTATARPSTPQMGTDGQRSPCLHLHHLPGGGRPAARMIYTTCPPQYQRHDGHGTPQELHRPAVHAPQSQRHGHRLHLHRMGEARERERGEGERSKAKQPSPTPSKSYIPNRRPTSTGPAPENSQPLPVLLPAQLLRPLSCNSAFGEFAEPRPPEAPIADGEHLPARLLSIQAPGEPLHFQSPGQFYKLTQYLPSLTYPSFFTRQ